MGLRPAAFEAMEPRLLLDGTPIITEVLADNGTPWYAGNPDSDWDWIEVYNPTSDPINLAGWRLTDDVEDLDQWTFPSVTLQAGQYLVVFASDGYVDPDPAHAGDLHTNFALSKNGDLVALVKPVANPGLQDIASQLTFGNQVEDVSYGLYQETQVTTLVPVGATASYLVPSGNIGTTWRNLSYTPVGWQTGSTGLGYETTVSGLAVTYYKANTTVGSLSVAESVVTTPSMQAAVFAENGPYIDYFNTGGTGHYSNNRAFPGTVINNDIEDFVVRAVGTIHIPTAGSWTFGVNSDDGFRLTINGLTTTGVTNSSTAAGSNTISYANPRGPGDTLGVFSVPAAGDYTVTLVMYERGGGSEVELYAVAGSYSSWSSTMKLVGDTPNGGLVAWSEPVGGTGGGGSFSSLIATDVETAMMGANASIYVRIPFTVTDPGAFEALTLRMKYDDGFIVYLNGAKVAERNAPASPVWNSTATAEHSNAQAVVYEDIDLSGFLGLLQAGTNVLAIQGLNLTAADGDFLLVPLLAEILPLGLVPRYFSTPSPGQPNEEGFIAFVDDTAFSVDRGFFDAPFEVALSCDTPDAAIYYTTDGSAPSETHGTLYDPLSPVLVSTTTVLRAVATRPDWRSSNVDTQTYIRLQDVLEQPMLPDGFPSTWGSAAADYEMDPEIVDNPLYTDLVLEGLLSLPTMSLVMDMADVFGAQGIYTLSTVDGLEKPGSIELFYPDGYAAPDDGFQVNCGVRIYGGVGREPGYKKHAFRLLFKSAYGPTKLKYDLFGEGAADEFDTLILRHNFNDGYVWGGARSQYIRDEYVRQLQLALGSPSADGTFVHLYVNGVYWGLYNPTERPDQSFGATYFGGEKEDWDAINAGAPTGESTTDTWNQMINLVRQGLTTEAQYQRLQGNNPDGTDNPAYPCYLDVENYAKYMLVNFFVGNIDWPGHNWYAARERTDDSTGFKSFAWDSEWVIGMNSDVGANITGASSSIAEPYAYLRQNAEWCVLFGDIVQQAFLNGGPLFVDPANPQWDPAHPERNQAAALYASLADAVELAMAAESARWGDVVSGTPYTLTQWQSQRDWVLGTYMSQRSAIVLQQLKAAGLCPTIDAPTFTINGVYQHGGTISSGDLLGFQAAAGTIYYTLDGMDPRAVGGGLGATALLYSAPVTLDESVHVMARVKSGGTWSALLEATFLLDTILPIRITEIMYNPPTPTLVEQTAGFLDNDDFEFVELRNIGDEPLDLEGIRFTRGINFAFPAMTLGVGEYVVVAKNPAAFALRYPGVSNVVGPFLNLTSLDNAGERLTLECPVGGLIQDFGYKDGWYQHTDGGGFSLVIRDPLGDLALWGAKDGWQASDRSGGSPGAGDSGVTPGSVIITEVLTHTDNLATGDWIELHNPTDDPINIGGWFLSDDPMDLTKYEIAADTWIPAGGHLVFDQVHHFGLGSTDPGCHVGFGLSELGETVYLSSQAPDGTAGGYRETQPFLTAERERTFGLYAKSTGGTDFVAMASPTWEDANSLPYVGPVVINEIMYHPDAGGYEYLELHNRSGATVFLYDPEHVENTWKFTDGVTFVFPQGISIPAGGYVVLTDVDPALFRAHYGVPGDVPVFQYVGSLGNDGETIELAMPGTPEPPSPEFPEGFVPYIRADRVTYDDRTPWPLSADGGGASLIRLVTGDYGNDPANWGLSTYGGTPGTLNEGIDNSPPSVPTAVTAMAVNTTQILVQWAAATDPDSGVAGYKVYRDGIYYRTVDLPVFLDVDAAPGAPYSYDVSAVNLDAVEGARSAPAVSARIVALASLTTPSATTLRVVFTEAVTAASAQVAAHYSLLYGAGQCIGIAAATLQPDGVTVDLALASPLASGCVHALAVSGVQAVSGTPVAPGCQMTFGYETLTVGSILWQYWTGIEGTAVANLTADARFPDSPSGSAYRTSFEAPVDWAEYYGARMVGYVQPTVTGDYTLWISSDDNSELWLSTDENPANRQLIAYVPGWTNSREWTRYAEQQSVTKHLVAGQMYYIEALQKEGGGGDNLAVAWTLPGQNPATVGPIQGQYLLCAGGTPSMTVSVEATDPLAAEAGADPGRFTITRTGSTAEALIVYYTVAGTASAGDYTQTFPRWVQIPAGAAQVTLDLTPVDDPDGEGDEAVALMLTQSPQYLLGTASATVMIADNDTVRVTAVELNDRAGRSASAIEPSGIGVRSIDITFSEAVNLASGAITLQKVTFDGLTEIPGDVLAPLSITGSGTAAVRIEFATAAVVDTWVKVVLNAAAVTSAATGAALDGEPRLDSSGLGYIYEAADDLPTGNGTPGGNAVFYVGSLRGDMQGPTFSDMQPEGRITVWDINGFTIKYLAGDMDVDMWGGTFMASTPEGVLTPWDINGFTILYRAAVAEGRHLDTLPTGTGTLAVGSPAPLVLAQTVETPAVVASAPVTEETATVLAPELAAETVAQPVASEVDVLALAGEIPPSAVASVAESEQADATDLGSLVAAAPEESFGAMLTLEPQDLTPAPEAWVPEASDPASDPAPSDGALVDLLAVPALEVALGA